MRKLKLQVQMSVDGFIAGPNGEMDWMEWNWGDDIKAYVTALTKPVDTILLGRKLAQGFIPHWTSFAANPETTDDFSVKMVETEKLVFTKTLNDAGDWKNTRLVAGDLVKEVNAVKQGSGGDIIAYGGGEFVSSLIENALIDDLHLFVNPTAVGKGMPIFQALKDKQKFKLVGATAFDCGIVCLNYQLEEKA